MKVVNGETRTTTQAQLTGFGSVVSLPGKAEVFILTNVKEGVKENEMMMVNVRTGLPWYVDYETELEVIDHELRLL